MGTEGFRNLAIEQQADRPAESTARAELKTGSAQWAQGEVIIVSIQKNQD